MSALARGLAVLVAAGALALVGSPLTAACGGLLLVFGTAGLLALGQARARQGSE